VDFPAPCAREVAAALGAMGIETRGLYSPPVHRHPAYLAYQCGEPMVNTERMSLFTLSLPCHGAMEVRDVDHIVRVAADVVRESAASSGDVHNSG
jgi:dTDP-4-amino-4,6-dideoxygalactose transaminase